jgi:hypothetical protein
MDARKRLAASLAVIGAAVAVAVPVASADPTPPCPAGYVKNLATGCAPGWLLGHGRLTNPSPDWRFWGWGLRSTR